MHRTNFVAAFQFVGYFGKRKEVEVGQSRKHKPGMSLMHATPKAVIGPYQPWHRCDQYHLGVFMHAQSRLICESLMHELHFSGLSSQARTIEGPFRTWKMFNLLQPFYLSISDPKYT